jgi:hypothetical protein
MQTNMSMDDRSRKFTMDEIGVEVSRQELIRTIGDAPAGGIIFVKGYESKNGHGEVADYWYLKGVNYGAMKDRSLAKLDRIEADPTFQIAVRWNEWRNTKTGQKTTAAAKDKVLKSFDRIFLANDDAVKMGIAKVRKSLTDPRPVTNVYEKEANGVYTQDDGTLHIRDCQLLTKRVVIKGDWPITTSSPEVAVADAIKALLPVGKYRQVRLDGRYDYVSVGGEIIMSDEGGNQTFIGFSEDKGLLVPRVPAKQKQAEVDELMDFFQSVLGFATIV